MKQLHVDADHAFGLTDKSLSDLRAAHDQLAAEVAECAIWLDSGYGPPPSMWTEEMWDHYIKSRQPVQGAQL